jgi:hypothetical protein
MFPNHNSNSRSNSSSVRKSFARGRSFALSFLPVGLAFSGCRATSSFWWCVFSNDDSPAAMALLERGSTLTLYGGSVFTRWMAAPPNNRSTSSGFEESPHSRRCSPRIHKSPGMVVASSGGAGTSFGSHSPSSGSPRNSSARSSPAKPVRSRSNPAVCKAASSAANSPSSHPESEADLLSAIRYARA